MGNLSIITDGQRMAERRGIKVCIFGSAGIGKTTQLWAIDHMTAPLASNAKISESVLKPDQWKQEVL